MIHTLLVKRDTLVVRAAERHLIKVSVPMAKRPAQTIIVLQHFEKSHTFGYVTSDPCTLETRDKNHFKPRQMPHTPI